MVPSLLPEPSRVDEPRAAPDYAAVLSRVAAQRQPVIVRRDGADLAAVVPLEHLELLRELLTQKENEVRADQLARERSAVLPSPPAWWFEDNDNPCEPEAEPQR